MNIRSHLAGLLLVWVLPLCAQPSLSLVQIIDAPSGVNTALGAKSVLQGERLVVSYPSASGGSVHIHARNEGGLDQWGRVQSLYAFDGQTSFGKAIGLLEEELFVGSDQGTWSYKWNASLSAFGMPSQIDDYPVSAITSIDTLLVTTSVPPSGAEGVLGAFDGLSRIFRKDDLVGSGWSLFDVVVIPPNPLVTGGWTCAGESVAIGRNVLVMGDPCYQSTLFGSSSNVFLVDRVVEGFDNNVIANFSVPEMSGRLGRDVAVLGDTVFLAQEGGWIVAIEWSGADNLGQHYAVLDTLFLEPYGQGEGCGRLDLSVDVSGTVYATTSEGVVIFHTDVATGAWDDAELLDGTQFCGTLSCSNGLLAFCVISTGEVWLFEDPSVGLSEISFHDEVLVVSPNPAYEHVIVNSIERGSGIRKLVLMDATGRTIRSIYWNALAPLGLDLSDVPDQVMLLRAEDAFGRLVGTARLVVGSN